MVKNYVEAEMKIEFCDLESDVITASGSGLEEDNSGATDDSEWDEFF